MERELSTLPIEKLTLMKLEKAGFSVIGDVVDFKAFELSKELGVSVEESLNLLKYLQEDILKKPNKLLSSKNVVSGDNLLKKEKKYIITFSSNLDDLLDGGISLGKITEICGPPGIGKTQFCMQLAIDVQLPMFCGGLESEALYIDTEGSFVVDRVLDIARSAVLHCHSISQNIENFSHTDKESLEDFHVKNILSRIHYFRCYEYIQLIAVLHTLEQFLTDHPLVRLVVVDSIAYVFRQDIEDFSMRSRHLNFVSQTFSKLCINHNISVVLVNHMTMKSKGEKNYSMVPALGEAWGHNCTYRLILHWADNLENSDSKTRSDSLQVKDTKRHRRALLYKSPSKQDSSVFYQITGAGIRDCVDINVV